MEKRKLIDRSSKSLTIQFQYDLLDIASSSLYYEPIPENPRRLEIMRQIDEIFLKYLFYGSRRIAVALQAQGCIVGRDLVRVLMRQMGIEAIYPLKSTSRASSKHKIYPYLLRGLKIVAPNQVWSADITYIPMQRGFLYLVAIMDWFSRYIISWSLSNSLDVRFCQEALRSALERASPKIFNTDQGAQFTAKSFLEILEGLKITISMDGRGRALDNVFIERFWRSLKYEEVYMKNYEDCVEAYESMSKYIEYYNKTRPHQSLGYVTPIQIYHGGVSKIYLPE